MTKPLIVLLAVGVVLNITFLSQHSISATIDRELQLNHFITLYTACGTSVSVGPSYGLAKDGTTNSKNLVVIVGNFRAENYPRYCSTVEKDRSSVHNMHCLTKSPSPQIELASTKIFSDVLNETGSRKTILATLVLESAEGEYGCVRKSDNMAVYYIRHRHPVAFGTIYLFEECHGDTGRVIIFQGKQRDNNIIKIIQCQACYVNCVIKSSKAENECTTLCVTIGLVCSVVMPLFLLWYSL